MRGAKRKREAETRGECVGYWRLRPLFSQYEFVLQEEQKVVVKEEEDALVAPPASPMSAAMAEAEAPKGISPELQVLIDL